MKPRFSWVVLALFAPVAFVRAQAADSNSHILWDQTLAPMSSILEPDAERVLVAALEGARDAGILTQKARATQRGLKRHAHHPVELALPVTTAEEDGVLETQSTLLLTRQVLQTTPASVRGVFDGYRRSYVFLDADDRLQREWWCRTGEKLAGAEARIVVTGGSPEELARALKRPVWADQGGVLTRRFDLTGVPSLVRLSLQKEGVTAQVTRFAVARQEGQGEKNDDKAMKAGSPISTTLKTKSEFEMDISGRTRAP